jgi:dsDNA-specific endonuclease/ATPase MutS2
LEKTQGELSETKKELEELRNVSKKSTGISSETLEKVYQDNQEKVNKLNEQLQAKENTIQELKQQLETKGGELEKAGAKQNLSSIIDKGQGTAEKFVRMAFERGDKVPLIGDALGGIAAIGTGAVHIGVVGGEIAAYFAEKGMDAGGYVFEKGIEEGSDIYKTTLKSGTEVAINAGTGAVSVIKRGMDSGDKIAEELKEFSESMATLGVGEFENLRKGAQEFASDAMHTAVDAVEN